MSEAFWQWECDVQAWWASIVFDLGAVYCTHPDVQMRMCRLGWRLLLVLTWPQATVRRLDYLWWRFTDWRAGSQGAEPLRRD